MKMSIKKAIKLAGENISKPFRVWGGYKYNKITPQGTIQVSCGVGGIHGYGWQAAQKERKYAVAELACEFLGIDPCYPYDEGYTVGELVRSAVKQHRIEIASKTLGSDCMELQYFPVIEKERND
jgi:hypothetical protein